jgi:uncharacterized protein YbjT (DUF2867 family)
MATETAHGQILIVGAHGTLGRPVTRRLILDGYSVRALARHPEEARKLLPGAVDVVAGDLADVASIDRAMEHTQAVYVSVDTLPNSRFHPETDGLRNVVQAGKNHPGVRLLVLSALGASQPSHETHPYWHTREKYEAQQITRRSGLAWTLFEPVWLMESLPLFVKGKTCNLFRPDFRSHWISGDDYGRMISAALSKNIGQEEAVPAQGLAEMSFEDAERAFIAAYDPSMKIRTNPAWLLKLAGLFNAQARELSILLGIQSRRREPSPNEQTWERYARPLMDIRAYAQYIRDSGDFPQK